VGPDTEVMDRGQYSIRPFLETDYEEGARLNSIFLPEYPETAEDARRWCEIITKDPGRLMRRLIAEEAGSGSVVAWAGLTHTLFNFHPNKYYVRVVVDPAHRRRGIGQELYRLLEKEAVERNALCLWGNAREDDPSSVRFLERQGFVATRKTWTSRLSLTDLDLSKFPDRSKALTDSGIRITTFAAEGADRSKVQQRLYELARITSEDAPRLGEYTPVTFEEFVAIDVGGSNAIPDAIFLACSGERYVAWSSLQLLAGLPDTLDIGFTGTLPEFRGRGIASELKRRAVMYARDRGYRYMVTGNDSLNPSIWAINEKLGFRKQMVLVQAEKKLRQTES
jgi:GNAT superfamily N-acetyltransferase